jgi:hypothetical protein
VVVNFVLYCIQAKKIANTEKKVIKVKLKMQRLFNLPTISVPLSAFRSVAIASVVATTI